jgi:hypothetical protein
MTKISITLSLLFWTTNLIAQIDTPTKTIKEKNHCINVLFSQLDSTKLMTHKSADVKDLKGKTMQIDSLNYKVVKVWGVNGTIKSQVISNQLVKIDLRQDFNSKGKVKAIGFTTSNNMKIGDWDYYLENYETVDTKPSINGENFDVSPFVTFCNFFEIAKINNLTKGEFDITASYDLGQWQIINKDLKEIMRYDAFKSKMEKSKMK